MELRAFTLVELLIVVVILAILAAVVIPQFLDASSDAQLSVLQQDLTTIRKAIELYKLQHNGQLPAIDKFEEQLTAGTDVNGDPSNDFGPYLERIPNNPFTDPAHPVCTRPHLLPYLLGDAMLAVSGATPRWNADIRWAKCFGETVP